MTMRLKIGDLVARTTAPAEPFRVTSIHGTASNGYVRLLPFRRQGSEVMIAKHAGAWIGSDGSRWVKP